MDPKAIKRKLQQLRSQTGKTKSFWKPDSGKSIVRFVPYKYSDDKEDHFPFVEMWFHYDLGLKNAPVALKTFGKADPIEEMANSLLKSGEKTDNAMGKKLQPKMRIFAPVIVRGKEAEGPKIWAFGKEVYTALLELIDDPEYDKIWDANKGTDINVSFKTAKEAGRNFPETKITPKRESTKLSDDKILLKKIAEETPNIHELYADRTFDYDELKDILAKWMAGEDSTDGQPKEEPSDSTETTTTVNEETNSNDNKISGEAVEEAAKTFEDLFNT
jgi:hypothetical protein